MVVSVLLLEHFRVSSPPVSWMGVTLEEMLVEIFISELLCKDFWNSIGHLRLQ